MADYNAHTYFGMKVLAALPPELRRRCVADLPVFRTALYGPDPLIFSFQTKKISDFLHKTWRSKTLPDLDRAFRSQDPAATSFAAGYFLHMVLDDVVHPRIYQWMETGSSHYLVEWELERKILREQGCLNPPRLITQGKDRTARAGAGILRPATPRQYLWGLRRMVAVTNSFLLVQKPAGGLIRPTEVGQGAILRELMEEEILPAARELEERMDRALSPRTDSSTGLILPGDSIGKVVPFRQKVL